MFDALIGSATWINALLIALVLLDLVLSGCALALPGLWFRFFHAVPYDDPQNLLRRTGAVWAAFALLQLIALFAWQNAPYWLALIAGVRLTEIFSDAVYALTARDMTRYGRITLLAAPPANLLMGLYLIASYLRLTSAS